MGAHGLRCLTRYPSVLPGLALAKTRTHHRDGTGCWGREMSKAGLRRRGHKGREERRERNKGRVEQGQGRDGREKRGKGKRKQRRRERTTGRGIQKRGRKQERHPIIALSFSCPFLWSKVKLESKSCCGRWAVAVGQVSVCYLGPDLSWAWEAKQPWGQETSLRRGEGSGPCKVGGVRVCAPPLLAPKFSPDGPSATVPVLGCSFPEESYPSLANQPSSGAKQGDVRCASEGGALPERVSSLSPW